jgi:hypothetical protein
MTLPNNKTTSSVPDVHILLPNLTGLKNSAIGLVSSYVEQYLTSRQAAKEGDHVALIKILHVLLSTLEILQSLRFTGTLLTILHGGNITRNDQGHIITPNEPKGIAKRH